MTLSTSFIDLRGLDWLWYIKAAADINRQLDPHYSLRMALGSALAPPTHVAANLGHGLWLVGMVR